jgi:hypothetical protein
VEKKEMVTTLLSLIAKQNTKRAERAAAERDEKGDFIILPVIYLNYPSSYLRYWYIEIDRETIRDRVVAEVAKWARDKSIKVMLNEVNGYNNTSDKGHLKRYSSYHIMSLYHRPSIRGCIR